MMAANTTTWSHYETVRQGSFIYLIIIGAIGIFSNSLVIIVFIKYDKVRTATNTFILNLALCDLVISVLDSAMSIPSTYSHRWLFGRGGCVCYGFLHYFFISITVSTLAAIAIDRFFYITKPAQVKTWRITKPRALAMLVIIYIYVLLLTFPPLTGWNSFITEEHFCSGCYINYSDQNPASIGYSVAASTFLFLMPLLVMIFCYAKIYTAVRTSTRKTITRKFGPYSTPATIRRKYPVLKRTHVQTAKMIFVVIFFCVIVWLPFVVVSLIKAFTGNAVILPIASHVTILITKSCVVYNVLIYVVLNRKLKAAIIDFVWCGRLPSWLVLRPNKRSSSKMRISKILNETDKDIPSDIDRARNRLSTIKGTENLGNEAGNTAIVMATPALRLKEKGAVNAGLELSTTSSMLKNSEIKSVDFNDDPFKSSRLKNTAIVLEDSLGVGSNNMPHGNAPLQTRSSQLDPDENGNGNLSFSCLEDEKTAVQRNQLSGSINAKKIIEITRVEERRRALRKIYQKETRKLPVPPNTEPAKDSQILRNHNNKEPHNFTTVYVEYSRENPSLTVLRPSSNNSTHTQTSETSETSVDISVKDKNSMDVPSRATSKIHRNSARKSRTLGYRKGKCAIERLKHSSKDPLHVSASELQEIQSYWKRMSLCLDEINIDEEV